jgi:sulfite reductase beta subunit-like hemoprotein
MLRCEGQEHVEGFKLYAGGGKGETPALAEELHPGFPAETVHAVVAWLAEEYRRANGDHPTSFADFVVASGAALRDELARRCGR